MMKCTMKYFLLVVCFSVFFTHARDFLKGTLAWSMQRQAAQFVPDVMITQNDIGTGGTFTITQPGTYGLAEDITFTTGTAITIDSDDVYLDLDGHTIDGLNNEDTTGIRSAAAHTNLIIKNGVIKNVDTGIESATAGIYDSIYILDIRIITTGIGINILNASNLFIENTVAINCTGSGFDLDGITRCSLVSCQTYNCAIGYNCASSVAVTDLIIKECFAHGGTTTGFSLGAATTDGLVVNNCAQAYTAGTGFLLVVGATRVQFFSNAANGNLTNYSANIVATGLVASGNAAIAAANNYWINVATP